MRRENTFLTIFKLYEYDFDVNESHHPSWTPPTSKLIQQLQHIVTHWFGDSCFEALRMSWRGVRAGCD